MKKHCPSGAPPLVMLWEKSNPGREHRVRSGISKPVLKAAATALKREPDLEEWSRAFEVCRERGCLNGTSTGFVATLGWALGPINSGKLMSGFYAADKRMATNVRGFEYEVPPGARDRLPAADEATRSRLGPMVRRLTGGAS